MGDGMRAPIDYNRAGMGYWASNGYREEAREQRRRDKADTVNDERVLDAERRAQVAERNEEMVRNV